MKTLFIDACAREQSRTRETALHLLGRLGGEYDSVSLYREDIKPLDGDSLSKRDGLLRAGRYDDGMFRFARQFAAAELIVVAAPYWDLSFPAALKAYIEQIMVNGVVFAYSEQGIPQSLCRAERLIYVSTAGGPVVGTNHGYEYVKLLCGSFWGIADVKLYQAENLDVFGTDPAAVIGALKAEIDRDMGEINGK